MREQTRNGERRPPDHAAARRAADWLGEYILLPLANDLHDAGMLSFMGIAVVFMIPNLALVVLSLGRVGTKPLAQLVRLIRKCWWNIEHPFELSADQEKLARGRRAKRLVDSVAPNPDVRGGMRGQSNGL